MTKDELGDVRSEHFGRNILGWIVAPLIVVFGSAFMIAIGRPWLVTIPVGAGLLALGVAKVWTPRRVLLRDDGLEVHRFFRKPSLMKFSDCRYVFREFTTHSTWVGTAVTNYILKLVDNQGHQLRLNPKLIREPEYLFNRIERLVTYPKHLALMDAFDRGEEVAFGKVTVNREGVRIAGRFSSWAEIKAVELSPRLLIFRFYGRFRRALGLERIPFPWGLVNILKAQGIRMKFFGGFKEPQA